MGDETKVIDEQEPDGYDEWVRREVEIGLKEAHAPGAVWRSAEDVNADMKKRREQLVRQAFEKAS
jgi:hypothetical protein